MIRVSKFRRTNGRWYLRCYVAGAQVDESTRTSSERDAESLRMQKELTLNNTGLTSIRHARVMDLIEPYVDSLPPQTSEKHLHESRRILEGFCRLSSNRIGTQPRLQTHQLTPELIDRYIRQRARTSLHDGTRTNARGRRIVRKKPISNVTLKKELRYISSFCSYLCKARPPYLRENPVPCSNAARIRSDARLHTMVTETELRQLLSHCADVRQYLFILLGWWCGARRNDIVRICFRDIDFDRGILHIEHRKNRLFSDIPLTTEIVEMVRQLYRGSLVDRVFPADPFPHHAFRRLCRKSNCRAHRYHDLRLSCSVRMRKSFGTEMASLWLGHSSITAYRHYSDPEGLSDGLDLTPLRPSTPLPAVPQSA